MKVVLIFLIFVITLVKKVNGTDGHVEMFLSNTNDFIGTINFYEEEQAWGVVVSGSVTRMRPMTSLGFHIHSLPIGNNHNCTSGGAHFNPYNVSHGMAADSLLERHVGDLGNIVVDANGRASVGLVDRIISLGLNNKTNVIGLTLMVHNLTDDGGHTGKGESSTTGNAGPRIACGTIQLD